MDRADDPPALAPAPGYSHDLHGVVNHRLPALLLHLVEALRYVRGGQVVEHDHRVVGGMQDTHLRILHWSGALVTPSTKLKDQPHIAHHLAYIRRTVARAVAHRSCSAAARRSAATTLSLTK